MGFRTELPFLFHVMELSKNDTRLTWGGGRGRSSAPDVAACARGNWPRSQAVLSTTCRA